MARTHKFDVEMTDLFGGEANYGWVRRETIEVPEDTPSRGLVLRAKRAMGMTGERGKTWDAGDMIEVRFPQLCRVIFITYHDAN